MIEMIEILNGIASVAQIARDGSFRGAMRSSGTGFRTLQKHVVALEATLGFPIFHRTPDGIILTTEGQAIVAEAENIEAAVGKILRLGKSLVNEAGGEVTLASTEGLGTFWITPQLEAFNAQNPNIAIRLHPSMSVADMRRYEIDLALQVIEPVIPEIKRVRVGRLHLVLAAAPSYIARYGRPNQVSDLARHTFVFHTNPQFSDRQIIETAVGASLGQAQLVVMRNSSAHYMTIEGGLGIGFIPSYGFAIGANLVPLNLPVRYEMDLWLCFHEGARNTPRLATVIDWLIKIFDPRLYPWFRKEFVSPRDFEAIINANGNRDFIRSLSLKR